MLNKLLSLFDSCPFNRTIVELKLGKGTNRKGRFGLLIVLS